MNVRLKFTCLLLLFFLSVGAYAQDIAGVNVSEKITLDNTTRKLNAVGNQSKLFFDIDIGRFTCRTNQKIPKWSST